MTSDMYNNYPLSENPNQTFSVHKRIIKLALGLVLLFSCAVTAQIERYSFQVAGGTYTPITGGAIVNINDPTPDHIFLDFPVFFGFFSYNRILIADTGGLYFAVGSTVIDPDDEFGDAISNNLGLAAIAPFSCNTNGYVDREIRYQTLGTAPNRVLVVQWKGFLRQYAATPEKFEYQCRIYETSNKIEFIYGNFTNPTNLQLSGQTGAQVGLRGGTYPYPSLKNLTIDAGGSWTSPIVGTGNPQARCHYNGDTPNTKPTSGLTYRFSPYDLSVSILPLPVGCAPGQMTVRITNTGADVYDFAANPICGQVVGTAISVTDKSVSADEVVKELTMVQSSAVATAFFGTTRQKYCVSGSKLEVYVVWVVFPAKVSAFAIVPMYTS
jgi:hypothetical protein